MKRRRIPKWRRFKHSHPKHSALLIMKSKITLTSLAAALLLAGAAHAQTYVTGSSSSAAPYLIGLQPTLTTYSVLTAGDTIGGYSMAGIPDGLGAFQSATDITNGTFTLLMNHELGSTVGATHDHGAIGSFASIWTINKNTLTVTAGDDLIKSVYGWDKANQQLNTTASSNVAFNRFCSADLPVETAFYNAATGLGTQDRIFMHGEEGGSTAWLQATAVTGTDAGKSFTLGKFNVSTASAGAANGTVGAWENALANPYAQDKTVVIGTNDGGTNIMANSVGVYVGTKTSSGTAADRAGLTNGTLKFVNVTGFADSSATTIDELSSTTTRANAMTGVRNFTLSDTASTTFSRPEDGAWNPNNPNEFYFVTTDRLDTNDGGAGYSNATTINVAANSQTGQTRLWKMTFSDITNPDAGGTIEAVVDGDTVGGEKVNMFDNISFGSDGTIMLVEDVGNASHNGKVWSYNTATDTLTLVAKHDPNKNGDVGVNPTTPFSRDEEFSGVIDITDIMSTSTLTDANKGRWYALVDQQHYAVAGDQVEGGQLLVVHAVPEPSRALLALIGFSALLFRRRRA